MADPPTPDVSWEQVETLLSMRYRADEVVPESEWGDLLDQFGYAHREAVAGFLVSHMNSSQRLRLLREKGSQGVLRDALLRSPRLSETEAVLIMRETDEAGFCGLIGAYYVPPDLTLPAMPAESESAMLARAGVEGDLPSPIRSIASFQTSSVLMGGFGQPRGVLGVTQEGAWIFASHDPHRGDRVQTFPPDEHDAAIEAYRAQQQDTARNLREYMESELDRVVDREADSWCPFYSVQKVSDTTWRVERTWPDDGSSTVNTFTVDEDFRLHRDGEKMEGWSGLAFSRDDLRAQTSSTARAVYYFSRRVD